jgi:hypothetical protein
MNLLSKPLNCSGITGGAGQHCKRSTVITTNS